MQPKKVLKIDWLTVCIYNNNNLELEFKQYFNTQQQMREFF